MSEERRVGFESFASRVTTVPGDRRSALALPIALLLAWTALAWPQKAAAFACQWTGATSTDWATASNWSSCNGTTPQSGDTVAIPSGGNQPVVGSGTSTGVSTVTVNTGASLTVASSGTLTLNSGLTGGGNLTVNSGGTLVWSAGTMDGAGTTTISAGGILTLSGFGKTLGRTLNLAAGQTATMSGASSYMYLSTGGTFNNNGTVDIQNDNEGFYSSGTPGPFNNAGLLKRTTGSGIAYIQCPFNNTGSVSVSSGTLSISGDGTHTGPFNATGATLTFAGGTQTLSAASTVTAANLNVSGGTITFNGALSVSAAVNFSFGTVVVNAGYSAGTSSSFGGTVTLNPAATLTSAGSTLNLSGIVTLNSGEAISVTSLNQSGGTLTGSDNITVSGTFAWTGGTHGGSGTTNANGPMDLSGFGKTLGRTLNLAAGQTATMSGASSYMYLSTGSTFNNNGTVDIQNDNEGFYSSGTPGPFNNAGLLKRTTGSGIAYIQCPFNNTGSVSVSSGTLSISGDGTHTGPFNATGATLTFAGGTQTLSAASTVTAANLNVSGGTITFNGALSVSAAVNFSFGTVVVNAGYSAGTSSSFGGTVTLNPAATLTSAGSTLNLSGIVTLNSGEAISVTSLNQSGGTLTGSDNITVSGTFAWTGGTHGGSGTTNANGPMDLSGFGKTLGRTLNLAAGQTATMSGASSYMYLSTGSTFNNNGTVDIQNDNEGFYSSGTPGPFNNAGLLKRTTGSGIAYIQCPFNNTGSVSVSSGTLSISGDGTHTGPFNATGATLTFAGGTQTLSAASTVTAANLNVSGGTITFNGALSVSAAVNFSFGTVVVNAGYSAGTSSSFGGTVTLNPAATLTSAGSTLNLSGIVTLNSGEAISVTSLNQSGGTLTGSDNITVSGTFAWTGGTHGGSGTTNANGPMDLSGFGKTLGRTLNLAAGQTATMSGASSYMYLSTGSTFNNNGTVDIQNDNEGFYSSGTPGPFNNAGTLDRTSGSGTAYVDVTFHNTGTVSVQSGILSVNDYTQTAGSTVLAGGNITAVTNPLRLQGGTLAGSGTVTGNVTSTAGAVVSPGFSAGLITITGNYIQSSPSALTLELGGTSPSDYDRVVASGTATFGGPLNVSLINGFSPVQQNAFSVFTYASRLGRFDTYNLPALSGGLSWVPRYGGTTFQLRVQAIVPTLPLNVDHHLPATGSPNLNGVLDPGERVLVEPTWSNPSFSPVTFTGTLSNFTGPAGATYTISKPNADYGTLVSAQTNNCYAATGNCYELSVSNPTTRPATHWDTTVDETASNGDLASWTIHIGGSFTDVAETSGQYRFVETLLHNLITSGCGSGLFCPASNVTRAQMAVFLLVSKFGASYLPPPATGTVFNDVPANSFAAAFIENLYALGVTAGCGGGNYCPNSNAIRAQMAVFLLRTLEGPVYVPPACVTATFNDVPCSSPYAPWIEEIYRRGITAGCGGGNFCPLSPVTRGQMAVFLTTTFGLVLNGP